MSIMLFLKTHIGGYTRKDGVVVRPHETKAFAYAHSTSSRHKGTPMLSSYSKKQPSHRSVTHPQQGEDGKPFLIHDPSVPSMAATWTDPQATAIFTPAGETPEALNGIALAPWADAPTSLDLWQDVDGQMVDLDEPDLITHGKDAAAGVVIEEADGRVWIVCPSNEFYGCQATFPKGRADDGISLQATAIKEAFEESGLQVEIIGLIGDVERSMTVTRYYRARRVGGTPAAMGWESQAVKLVPKEQVTKTVNLATDRHVASLAGVDGAA